MFNAFWNNLKWFPKRYLASKEYRSEHLLHNVSRSTAKLLRYNRHRARLCNLCTATKVHNYAHSDRRLGSQQPLVQLSVRGRESHLRCRQRHLDSNTCCVRHDSAEGRAAYRSMIEDAGIAASVLRRFRKNRLRFDYSRCPKNSGLESLLPGAEQGRGGGRNPGAFVCT